MRKNKDIIFEKSNIKKVILYFLYRILLDYLYIKWASPIYGYMGLLLDPTLIKICISYVLLLICLFIIPKDKGEVSYMILQLHLIVMIIPLTTVYSMANLPTKYMLMILVCFCFQNLLIKYLPIIKINKIKDAKLLYLISFVSLTLVTYIYSLITQGVNFSVLDITSIYEIRSTREINSVMAYLTTWQFRIVTPTLIVLSYIKKKYKLFVLGIGLQVLMYLMYPNKEVFLSLILILFCLVLERKKLMFDSVFMFLLSFGSLTSVVIYEVQKNINFFFIIAVRLLYVPAIIKFWHYEFFLVNQKLYYSEGLIGKVLGLEYPYSVASGFLMKDGLMGNANTGYLAYAYDNAGFVGMILMSFIFALLLKLIDSLVINEKKGMIFSLLVYPMIVLNDGDLLTLLLTGGLFLLIFFLVVNKSIDTLRDEDAR